MPRLPCARRRLATALALLAPLAVPVNAAADACALEPHLARPAAAARLADSALQQNAAMGGAAIDAGGGLIRQGFAEAERAHAPGSSEAAWQRVWNYWRAAPDVYARDFAWMEGFASTAQQRVALIDRPWSAVFISWIVRAAGLQEGQFAFSALHGDYVRAALDATGAEARGQATDYAYRACNIATTAPRVGDLLCFARGGDDYLDTFERLDAVIGERTPAMHCELVVTQDGAGVETVGGNVVQTVALRRMRLADDGSGTLAPDYRAAAHRWQRAARILHLAHDAPPLADTHLSLQPWSVLLQLRGAALAPATTPIVPPTATPAPMPDDAIYRN